MSLIKKNIDLSIIVPLYNEEDCIQPLYDAVVQSIGPLHLNYEILFVDDGSKDTTFLEIKRVG